MDEPIINFRYTGDKALSLSMVGEARRVMKQTLMYVAPNQYFKRGVLLPNGVGVIVQGLPNGQLYSFINTLKDVSEEEKPKIKGIIGSVLSNGFPSQFLAEVVEGETFFKYEASSDLVAGNRDWDCEYTWMGSYGGDCPNLIFPVGSSTPSTPPTFPETTDGFYTYTSVPTVTPFSGAFHMPQNYTSKIFKGGEVAIDIADQLPGYVVLGFAEYDDHKVFICHTPATDDMVDKVYYISESGSFILIGEISYPSGIYSIQMSGRSQCFSFSPTSPRFTAVQRGVGGSFLPQQDSTRQVGHVVDGSLLFTDGVPTAITYTVREIDIDNNFTEELTSSFTRDGTLAFLSQEVSLGNQLPVSTGFPNWDQITIKLKLDGVGDISMITTSDRDVPDADDHLTTSIGFVNVPYVSIRDGIIVYENSTDTSMVSSIQTFNSNKFYVSTIDIKATTLNINYKGTTTVIENLPDVSFVGTTAMTGSGPVYVDYITGLIESNTTRTPGGSTPWTGRDTLTNFDLFDRYNLPLFVERDNPGYYPVFYNAIDLDGNGLWSMSYQKLPEPRYEELDHSVPAPIEFGFFFGGFAEDLLSVGDITEVYESIGAAQILPNRLWGSTTSLIEEFGIKII